MDWRKISDWLQVIGIFGVIASLIFVGMQMRQTQDIALADIYQTRAALKIQNFSMEASSQPLQEVIDKWNSGQDLTDSDMRILVLSWFSWLSYWENNYFQYKLGMMKEEQWQGSVNAIRNFARRKRFRDWWAEVRTLWPASYTREVDAIVAEVTSRKES